MIKCIVDKTAVCVKTEYVNYYFICQIKKFKKVKINPQSLKLDTRLQYTVWIMT